MSYFKDFEFKTNHGGKTPGVDSFELFVFVMHTTALSCL